MRIMELSANDINILNPYLKRLKAIGIPKDKIYCFSFDDITYDFIIPEEEILGKEEEINKIQIELLENHFNSLTETSILSILAMDADFFEDETCELATDFITRLTVQPNQHLKIKVNGKTIDASENYFEEASFLNTLSYFEKLINLSSPLDKFINTLSPLEKFMDALNPLEKFIDTSDKFVRNSELSKINNPDKPYVDNPDEHAHKELADAA